MRQLAGLLLLLVLTPACSGSKGSADCLSVSADLRQQIEAGITERGATVETIGAIPSEDFEGVWVVGAELGGSLSEQGDVAIWTTNHPPSQGGARLIMAANLIARTYSNLGVDVPDDASIPVARARESAITSDVESCLS